MGGVTASGYPYITSADHPKEYPTASQALVAKLDADNTWVAYTPVVVGCTVQSTSCWYYRSGGLVTVDAFITVNAVSGNTTISVPFTPLVNGTWAVCSLDDVGTTTYIGAAAALTTSGGVIGCYRVDPTNQTRLALTSTTPFTWAAGDTIHALVTYRVAP